MNNSTKFKIAHKITKANIQRGDSYSATFAASLAWVNDGGYALTGASNEIILTRKISATNPSKYSIVKCDAELAAQFDVVKDLGDGYYKIKSRVRADESKLSNAIAAAAKNAKINAGYSSRKIVTLEYAQLMGLSHGKSWMCTEYHVELKGACPSFEGQLICYAYTA